MNEIYEICQEGIRQIFKQLRKFFKVSKLAKRKKTALNESTPRLRRLFRALEREEDAKFLKYQGKGRAHTPLTLSYFRTLCPCILSFSHSSRSYSYSVTRILSCSLSR